MAFAEKLFGTPSLKGGSCRRRVQNVYMSILRRVAVRTLMTGLASVLVASALSMPADAQDVGTSTPSNTDRATNRTSAVDNTTNDDNGFNPGWLGLIGLIGLAGLMPRDRRDRHVHTAGTTPVTR